MPDWFPHAIPAADVAATLSTDPRNGLAPEEAAARLQRYGPNRPRPERRPPYARIAARQLVDPMVGLLLAATAISIAIGDTVEGVAIAAIVVLNGILGFWQEAKAEQAVRALSHAFTQNAVVVRGGEEATLPAEDVVPGDLIVVGEGDRVAADVRVTETWSLEANESALTGESLPVPKSPEPVTDSAPLAERSSMLHAGTGVTRGRGRGIVCATGPATELGRIAQLASEAPPPETPLTRSLGALARLMVVAGVVITVVLSGSMLLRGEELHAAFLTGVAVAVAAVPEGLAATVTAALALGARAMARRGAIVRRLAAIETMGETSVICTDKTGTLTENRISVAELMPAPGVEEGDLLRAAVRSSAAHRAGDEIVGDPVEAALVREALDRGIGSGGARDGLELVHEIPFDSDRKRMTRVWDDEHGRHAYTKGAPEVMADLADGPADSLLEAASDRAARGFRVLGLTARALEPSAPLDEGVERGGTFIGVVALQDPLRAESADAVATAARAGIEVRMVTGDHAATARTIGHEVGLADDAIVARATPADKLALVTRLQESGHVVAVTGDGVNDAPALRRADVGIAMGRSGTEAAREASSIVLTDDNFATIVAAIAEGRRIADNIRKFIAFLLSANLGEVIAFVFAIAANLGPPLGVVHVLLVNLVTDGLPAIALAQDPADPSIMRSPPRRGRLLDDRLWRSLALIGPAVGAATLASFEIGRAMGGGVAQSMAFTTLALSELTLVFAFRSATQPAWRLPPNRWLIRTVLLSVVVIALVVYLPAAHEAASTVSLSLANALVAIGLALIPAVLVDVGKLLRSRRAAAAPQSG